MMKTKPIFFMIYTALCLYFLTANAEAQNGMQETRLPVTIEQAVDYALKNSYQIRSATIDLEMKKRMGDISWNVLLPNLQVNGTMDRANKYIDTTSTIMGGIYDRLSGMGLIPPSVSLPRHTETESDHWSATVGLNLSWNFNIAMIQNIRSTHVDYEAELLTWEQAQRQIERDVRKMFYSLLLAQENLSIRQTTLQNAKNRAEQAETNYRSGRISQLRLLQTQVAYENQKPAILRMEQSVDQNLSAFAFLLGLPDDTKLSLVGTIDTEFIEFDGDELMAQNLNSHLDLRLLNKNIASLKMQLSTLNLSAYTPSLSLNYGYRPAVSLSQLDNGWTDRGSLSFTLSWNIANILPFSSSRQQAENLRATIEKLRINTEMVTRQAVMGLRQIIGILELSRAAIEASEKTVNMAETAFRLTETAYQNGAAELFDLRDAEASFNEAKIGMLNEQFNYITGLLDLEYELNTRFLP
jgi:outer membrane protein TolC